MSPDERKRMHEMHQSMMKGQNGMAEGPAQAPGKSGKDSSNVDAQGSDSDAESESDILTATIRGYATGKNDHALLRLLDSLDKKDKVEDKAEGETD